MIWLVLTITIISAPLIVGILETYMNRSYIFICETDETGIIPGQSYEQEIKELKNGQTIRINHY